MADPSEFELTFTTPVDPVVDHPLRDRVRAQRVPRRPVDAQGRRGAAAPDAGRSARRGAGLEARLPGDRRRQRHRVAAARRASSCSWSGSRNSRPLKSPNPGFGRLRADSRRMRGLGLLARRQRAQRAGRAVAIAASAASRPLSSFEPGSPARSRPCCSSSRVSTPKPTGLPVSRATRVRPSVAAADTYSKCGVPPRMITPSATTASAPASRAAFAHDGQLEAAGHAHERERRRRTPRACASAPAISAVGDLVVPAAGDDHDR